MAITDESIWSTEERLWLGDVSAFEDLVGDECLMVFPGAGILERAFARAALASSPRWLSVEMTQRQMARVGRTNIVLAYHANARRDQTEPFEGFCSSTYRAGDDGWKLIQHQQAVIH